MEMDFTFDDIIACLSDETRRNFLFEASKSTNPRIRYEVAKSSYTPNDILTNLKKDRNFYVRWGLVENVKTSYTIIDELTTDPNADVRNAARDELARRNNK